MTEDFRGAARRIEGDRPFREAAARLGCELAAVRAVAEVESRGAPFLADGRPAILFERHVFRRETGGRFDASHPALSGPPGGYGAAGAHQHARLLRAVALDREAALRSASWGAYQVMGFNAEWCGWPDVEAFVAGICDDEAAHLHAFTAFVERSRALVLALRARDWAAFARGYNGPAYAINAYDRKLAEAYARHAGRDPSASPHRVESVKDLQRGLLALGFAPGPVDGLWGERTLGAARAFLSRHRVVQIAPTPTAPMFGAVQIALSITRSYEEA